MCVNEATLRSSLITVKAENCYKKCTINCLPDTQPCMLLACVIVCDLFICMNRDKDTNNANRNGLQKLLSFPPKLHSTAAFFFLFFFGLLTPKTANPRFTFITPPLKLSNPADYIQITLCPESCSRLKMGVKWRRQPNTPF